MDCDVADRKLTRAVEGRGSPIDPRMTFANYLVGRGNLLSHAAMRHVADERPGSGAMFNPLFVHAAQGRGKTHLLQALTLELRSGPRPVRYLSGRDFPRRDAGIAAGLDVLIVDDVDLIATKQQRAAFAHLMTEMADGGRQVVVSATEKPGELQFDEQVKRRIAGGLIVELGDLDQDLRLEILRHKAAFMVTAAGIAAPEDDMLRIMASRLAGSARDLVAALQAVFAAALAFGGFPSGAASDALLDRVLGSLRGTEVGIDKIQSTAARYFGVTRSELLSTSRHSSIVLPRHVAMYLAKEMTTSSLPEIGRRFGGRDHTTVLHGVRKIADRLTKSAHLVGQVDDIKRLLLEIR
jgi:chromosomal replication initiator protein